MALAAIFYIPIAFGQQDDGRKKEKIEQLKIAFITKELELTSEEATEFWPVYNNMANDLKAEKKKQRKASKEIRTNKDSYSESDYKKKSSEILDSQIKEAELKKDYFEKIAAIIGYKKATKLLSLEQRFKRELLNRVNNGERKPDNGRSGDPMPEE